MWVLPFPNWHRGESLSVLTLLTTSVRYLSNPMRFIDGSPTFAAEVRSENDYGNAAEAGMAAKRADYFEAGTQVVWDVDPVNNLVRKYSRDCPDDPVLFLPGQEANAEPAVPGWTMAVERILPDLVRVAGVEHLETDPKQENSPPDAHEARAGFGKQTVRSLLSKHAADC